MTRYQITHTTRYVYGDAIGGCHNLCRLPPRPIPHRQRVERSAVSVRPDPGRLTAFVDSWGNTVHGFDMHRGTDGLDVTATSEVSVTAGEVVGEGEPWEAVRDEARRRPGLAGFLFDSPYIDLSPAVTAYAADLFPAGRGTLVAARELMHRVFTDFDYDPAATTLSTRVGDLLDDRRGVCQDFAHLQIACLRALGVPARYVSGYLRTEPPPGKPRLVGADASHAWLSVWCGDDLGWQDLDPTNDLLVNEKADHVTLAWGRDYADVSPIKGVVLGGGSQRIEVSVDVAPVDE